MATFGSMAMLITGLFMVVLLPTWVHGFASPRSAVSTTTTPTTTTFRRWKPCRPSSLIRVSASVDIDGGTSDDDDVVAAAPLLEPLGVGVLRDFRRRLPYYRSDVVDGLNAQSLATVLFLFFACLAPAVGFGALLDVGTDGAMGAAEMVSSTAACGVLYALFSAQPMQLLGPMGPVVAFTLSLRGLATAWSVPFLPLYAWTGLWTGGILVACALTSASHAARYLTRFTDEIFSVLISTIFIVEALSNVAGSFAVGSSPVAALLTLGCAAFTFGSSLLLKEANRSVFLTRRVRAQLSNFAPALGVLLGSSAARAARLRYGAVAALPALSLPARRLATTSGRPWRVPLGALPVRTRFLAVLPALFAAALLFLDQNITARLVNDPRYKMVKGRDTDNVLDGTHGDMLVLGLLTAACSLVGLPWMGGATTRSAAHVRSLSIPDDETGEILGALENRVSGAAVHGLIGACVLFAAPRAALAAAPSSVLYGVFLYLGLTSLRGLELWDRLVGLFEDRTVAPPKRWTERGVSRTTETIFTLAQAACVGIMMWVTKSRWGVLSPLLLLTLPLLREALMRTGVVKREDMRALDG